MRDLPKAERLKYLGSTRLANGELHYKNTTRITAARMKWRSKLVPSLIEASINVPNQKSSVVTFPLLPFMVPSASRPSKAMNTKMLCEAENLLPN